MIKRSLPDIFTDKNLSKKFENSVFFVEKENESNILYRIEMDDVTDCYMPMAISNLPSLYYEYEPKRDHMISFLKSRHIHFKLDRKNIVIFDPNVEEYNIVEAPLYMMKKDTIPTYYKKGTYSDEFPTQKMGEAAYAIFKSIYKRIKAEEVMYDFSRLTIDGGKSAYFEDYSRENLYYLNKNKFLLFDLNCNPNHNETPYNDYTKHCRVVPSEENGYYSGACIVVFDKEKIAKCNFNGDIDIELPTDVASIVIGKAGDNVKKLIYLLGVKHLNVNVNLKNVV